MRAAAARVREPLKLEADVLVIGGGLAATWAALGAARAGASVVLADKGYCGTSGVTASAGPGHWWVPPEGHDEAISKRLQASGGLNEAEWMRRVLEATWEHLPSLAPHYPFPRNERGQLLLRSLRGPEYLRLMRQLVEQAGVRILDHSPALELLQHADGSIAGAAGIRRQTHLQQPWTVRAGAVVLATGGCAFLSWLLGAHNNTGDGYLMAAEAGAELSGMEFTNYYTVAPAFSSMTRSMSYVFARYFDADGHELSILPGPDSDYALARELLKGPVFCSLDRMPQDLRDKLPQISPNVLLPFARRGIDPFRDRFEVKLRGEGTVRGIGGLRIAADDCETTVKGLYAAGDAATRELVAGAISGGGAVNSAWALSSGLWAGRGAAKRARRDGRRAGEAARAIGETGLRPRRQAATLDTDEAIRHVQRPMLDYDLNIFREETALAASQQQVDGLWEAWRDHAQADGIAAVRSREVAAMLATARWNLASARRRRESRGMHYRADARQADPAQAHRILSGGLDEVWTRADRPWRALAAA